MSATARTQHSVEGPAKLNLYLHVTGRRADGYHTLDSLIAFAGLADAVTVRAAPAGTFSLSIEGPFAGPLVRGPGVAREDNLVVRAARALDAFAGGGAGGKHGCEIALVKNIPVAAGLGGGSADAAATLLALSRLWNVADAPLAKIGLALGADVPVCLASVPARVSGIGEDIAAAPVLPEIGLVLANPRAAVETRAVFQAFDAHPAAARPAPKLPSRFADARSLAGFLEATGNDLTEAAQTIAPAIGAVLAALGDGPGCRLARMAGSGATCFALHDDPDAAAASARALAKAHPGWWIWSGGFGARGAVTIAS